MIGEAHGSDGPKVVIRPGIQHRITKGSVV